MKKFVLIFAVAGFFTACNNSANTTADKKDSIDSVASQKKDMVDSSAGAKKDVIDSSANAKKDMLDKKDSAMKHDSTHKM